MGEWNALLMPPAYSPCCTILTQAALGERQGLGDNNNERYILAINVWWRLVNAETILAFLYHSDKFCKCRHTMSSLRTTSIATVVVRVRRGDLASVYLFLILPSLLHPHSNADLCRAHRSLTTSRRSTPRRLLRLRPTRISTLVSPAHTRASMRCYEENYRAHRRSLGGNRGEGRS